VSFSATDLQAIKAAISGNATALADWTAGNPGTVAEWLNAASTTNLTRMDVTNTELFHALVASEVLALTVQQLTMLQLAGAAGRIDFTNANVAGGLSAIFPSTSKTYANIMTLAQRAASNLEAVFTSSAVCRPDVYGMRADVALVIAAMGA
jgi:hypothetical protein